MGLVHWDDVEPRRRAKGEMDATWQRLGAAGGAETVGLNRVRVARGMLSTPPHSHTASEEHFFVLGGSGLAWQDEACHEVRTGTCVVHRANEHEHTLRAGPDGLDYLVYGTNHTTELGWLPRSRAVRTAYPWFEGRVVVRPPGSRVGHAFEAGPDGDTMLVYGTRRKNDIVYYHRSKKIFWRGVGLIGRVDALDYDDGEPQE